jgi:hypothetical protein
MHRQTEEERDGHPRRNLEVLRIEFFGGVQRFYDASRQGNEDDFFPHLAGHSRQFLKEKTEKSSSCFASSQHYFFTTTMEDYNAAPVFTVSDDNYVVGDLADEDVEDQVVHDQLPSVEAAKANLAHKPAGGISSLKWTICAGLAFVILIVGVTLLAVLVPKGKSGSSSSSSPTPEESREDNVIKLLLLNEITPESTLRIPSSPQARAAQFIANGDSYQLAINEETVRGFIERYVLAIIYFHFNGESWTFQNNFMTSQDHCNWFQKFTTTGGSIIREGVLCNEEGHVTTLSLCKLSMVSSLFDSAALFQSVPHSYIF